MENVSNTQIIQPQQPQDGSPVAATSNSGKTVIKAGAIVSIVLGSMSTFFLLITMLTAGTILSKDDVGTRIMSGIAIFMIIAILFAFLSVVLGIVQLTVKKLTPSGHLAIGIVVLVLSQLIGGILIIVGASMEMSKKN